MEYGNPPEPHISAIRPACTRIPMLAFLLFGWIVTQAQDPVADFSSLSAGCLNQNIKFTNTSSNATSYTWDFCHSDLTTLSEASPIATVTESNTPIGISAVYFQGNWYGFLASRGNGKIFRLNFGSSLENTPSSVTDLGITGISGPENLRFIEEGGIMYAIAVDFSAKRILRLKFTSGIEEPPTVSNLTALGMNQPRSLDIVKSGSNYIVAVSDFNNNGISLINFGTSITNNPTTGDVTNVLTGSIPGAVGIRLLNNGSTWYGFVASYNSNTVKRINFGATLSATASIDQTYTVNGNPTELSVQQEGLNYYLFCASNSGGIRRLNLGTDIGGNTFTDQSVGTYGRTFGFDLVRSAPIWYGFAVDLDTKKIHRLKFSGTCSDVSMNAATELDPVISYSTDGDYIAELTAYSALGKTGVKRKQVTIQNVSAPIVSFTRDNACVSSPITFSPGSSGSSLTSWEWNFGDSQTSILSNPTHTYASAGTYKVTLNATASNGCGNYVENNLSFYDAPLAGFNLPTNNPLCTNQLLTFTNTSTVADGAPVQWEWSVNDVLISTTEMLEYAFDNNDEQTIELKASIPGCSHTATQTINSLTIGPKVSFVASNYCQGQQTSFINNTTGTVTGYLWSFGDGQSSTETEPVYTYNDLGDYLITLVAESPGGCNNTHTELLSIYSQPQAAFTMELPPFSCSGTPTHFNDATPIPPENNITSWSWNFGDPGSTSNTSLSKDPKHTYTSAGNYTVTLTAGTNHGCSNTVQKVVTISQAPSADFTHTPACRDVAVTFTGVDSDVTSWTWIVGDTQFFSAKPSHVFLSPGSYNVSLAVTAANGCVSNMVKSINVPHPVVPSFSVTRNCLNNATQFQDATAEGADPIQVRQWTFDNSATASGAAVEHAFKSVGVHPVQLKVTTESGCVYTSSNTITIFEAPDASFSANPETGTPPMNVTLTADFTSALQYSWSVDGKDDTVMTENSFATILEELGDHVIDLTVTNEHHCTSTSTRIITVSNPILDVALKTFIITEQADGSINSILTVKNEGNVTAQHITLLINVAGIELRETISGPISPGITITHIPSFNIVKGPHVNYVCAELKLEDEADVSNNQLCSSLAGAQAAIFFAPYPNPSVGDLAVEWIAGEAKFTRIRVIDSMGNQKFDASYDSRAGLNRAKLDLGSVGTGIYFLVIDSGNTQDTFRFLIAP